MGIGRDWLAYLPKRIICCDCTERGLKASVQENFLYVSLVDIIFYRKTLQC